jgi:hypothetical protein
MRLHLTRWLVVLSALLLLSSSCIPVVGEAQSEEGTVRFHVVDPNEQGVPGVRFVVDEGERTKPAAVTDEAGRTFKTGPEGTWRVTITPPAGYAVPASQANPFTV